MILFIIFFFKKKKRIEVKVELNAGCQCARPVGLAQGNQRMQLAVVLLNSTMIQTPTFHAFI